MPPTSHRTTAVSSHNYIRALRVALQVLRDERPPTVPLAAPVAALVAGCHLPNGQPLLCALLRTFTASSVSLLPHNHFCSRLAMVIRIIFEIISNFPVIPVPLRRSYCPHFVGGRLGYVGFYRYPSFPSLPFVLPFSHPLFPVLSGVRRSRCQ